MNCPFDGRERNDKKMKNKSKTQKGITLIALIVTIIVILILAGIVIAQLTGDGLIEKSKNVKLLSEESQAEEKLNMEIMKVQIQYEGRATIMDLYNDFKSSENSTIDVIEVKSQEEATISYDESKVKAVIKEITVVVKGYLQFDFSIDTSCSITKICGIPKNEWNSIALEQYSTDEINISLDKTNEIVNMKETLTIKAEIYPENLRNKRIIWSSSDEKIATVENGVVNVLQDGEVIITAMSVANNTKKATCKITGIWDGTTTSTSLEGTGTSTDNYTIRNICDLMYMKKQIEENEKINEEDEETARNASFKLVDDIDYNYGNYTINQNGNYIFDSDAIQWSPISENRGIFDGNNHVIKGIYINTSSSAQGLFAKNYGTIKNVIVEGYVYATGQYIGGIVGENYGLITNCINKCDINCPTNSSNEQVVGGICGHNGGNNAIIQYCGNYNNISGRNRVRWNSWNGKQWKYYKTML